MDVHWGERHHAACEPLCVNQAASTALLVIMPTLDDVDIAAVQSGDQSRDVVIPGLDGPGSAAGGHGRGGGPPAGRGGVPVGGGPAGSRSGAPTSDRGGGPASGSSVAPALGKGKQTCVILDDDEVSSDEDEPLQKRLRQLFDVGPAVLDEAAATTTAADKEAADKRATEEAMAKRVAEERAAVEAAVKAATAEEVAGKTADEAAGATGAHRPPTRRPCSSKRLHPASQTSLQGCLEISVCPAFSPFFFSVGLHSLITLFA
jgi:hypothetical protein